MTAKVVALRGPQAGFEAGQYGRRLKAIPTSNLAINSAIRNFGRNAIARSRFLCVNHPFMTQAKEEFVAALVGDGIKPSFVVDDKEVKKELQETWTDWTDESDADGLTDYYGQQVIIGNEMFEAGECFIRIRPRRLSDGLTVPMQLQLLPSEMVPIDYNMSLGNGRRIECGIQFNAIGKREGYWFYRNHPGELQFNFNDSGSNLYFVPADQVLHLFKPIRAGQVRGVPHTLAGIITAALTDLYDDAELERKRTAALFAAFVQREANEDDNQNPLATGQDASQNQNSQGQESVGMEPGATIDLQPGQTVAFSNPADVGPNYESFQYRMALRASAGLGVPYAQVTGDLRQANYGSLRTGMVMFKRRVSMLQNSVMIFQLCRPIIAAWLESAILANTFKTFNASEFAAEPRAYGKRVRWITPKWDWVDPLKDVTADNIAVQAGFKSRSDVIESLGEDAEETDARIAADQERADEMGIKFAQVATGIVVTPGGELSAETLTGPPGFGDNNPSDAPPSGDAPPVPPKKAAPPAKKAAAKKRKAPTRYNWDH